MRDKGFTLIEILVVLGILVLLVVALYGGYVGALRQGRAQTACAFGASVRAALERELQRSLNETLTELLQRLGLPTASPPPEASLPNVSYWDCGRDTPLWSAPPPYVACRVAARTLQVPNPLGGTTQVEGPAVYTWVVGAQGTVCLNGARP